MQHVRWQATGVVWGQGLGLAEPLVTGRGVQLAAVIVLCCLGCILLIGRICVLLLCHVAAVAVVAVVTVAACGSCGSCCCSCCSTLLAMLQLPLVAAAATVHVI